ncbi:MAG: HEPN domain-containing protein [Nanoarchaeota archaeon]
MKIAEEFFDAVRKNINSSGRTSTNRLYFAFEKAVISYIYFKKRDVPKNHQKLWELSSELLGKEYYSLFRVLYDLRMQADYGNISIFADLNIKNIQENLNKAESLAKELKLRMKDEK